MWALNALLDGHVFPQTVHANMPAIVPSAKNNLSKKSRHLGTLAPWHPRRMSSPAADATPTAEYTVPEAQRGEGSFEGMIMTWAKEALVSDSQTHRFISLLRDMHVKTVSHLAAVPGPTMSRVNKMTNIGNGQDAMLRNLIGGNDFVWLEVSSVSDTPGSTPKKKNRGGKRKNASEEQFMRTLTLEQNENSTLFKDCYTTAANGGEYPATITSHAMVTKLVKSAMPQVLSYKGSPL